MKKKKNENHSKHINIKRNVVSCVNMLEKDSKSIKKSITNVYELNNKELIEFLFNNGAIPYESMPLVYSDNFLLHNYKTKYLSGLREKLVDNRKKLKEQINILVALKIQIKDIQRVFNYNKKEPHEIEIKDSYPRKSTLVIKDNDENRPYENRPYLKLYTISVRHLSQIQIGVQMLHAVVEYFKGFGQSRTFKDWSTKDKTVVSLVCHSSSQLEEIARNLSGCGLFVSRFREPDLNDALTSIAFIAPAECWDDETYPSYEQYKMLHSGDRKHFPLTETEWIINIWDGQSTDIIEGFLKVRDIIKPLKLA